MAEAWVWGGKFPWMDTRTHGWEVYQIGRPAAGIGALHAAFLRSGIILACGSGKALPSVTVDACHGLGSALAAGRARFAPLYNRGGVYEGVYEGRRGRLFGLETRAFPLTFGCSAR